ncbi:hypothetical protein [Streptomyces chrestomyceticus]|uniref:hypothetical protein n=1 Tax=Streptomyces chrestomyceticus TaxID=68185 RepID=UPI0019D15308|nr:hypothetical protein [Streptomyces chrestomyceticus]
MVGAPGSRDEFFLPHQVMAVYDLSLLLQETRAALPCPCRCSRFADVALSGWEAFDPLLHHEHIRTRRQCGALKHWQGDVGIDATALPSWHLPPSGDRRPTSVDITAGWHKSGSKTYAFGLSGHLALAAQPGPGPTRIAHLALGLVVDRPGRRTGANAIMLLTQLAELGLPPGILAVDRLYTDVRPEKFARPAPWATASCWITKGSGGAYRASTPAAP